MSINGKIDRVDVEEEDGTVYIKVIDYKSIHQKTQSGGSPEWRAASACDLFCNRI